MNQELPIGQGHGIEGRYAGLPDPYGSQENSKIVILSVPFDQTTTYSKGSDKGPAAIIEASRNLELYDIETDSEVYLEGIYTDHPILENQSEMMLRALYERVKTLLNEERFVVTLGGEHSISYGAIKAFAEHFGEITVLQLDAHADLQPAYENNPWSHASVMARVKEIVQVKKIVSIGVRSMSREEVSYLDGDHTFFAHKLDEPGKWMETVLAALSGPIYLTFDLDAFDSSLMPSTGTPEPGGLHWNQTLKFLKRVFEQNRVVGFDVVELCPYEGIPAPDYLAAKLIYKLLSYKFMRKK